MFFETFSQPFFLFDETYHRFECKYFVLIDTSIADILNLFIAQDAGPCVSVKYRGAEHCSYPVWIYRLGTKCNVSNLMVENQRLLYFTMQQLLVQ